MSSGVIPKRTLGKTGWEVFTLGFGALEIGRDWAADVNVDPSHLDQAQARDLLHGVLDRGINILDTAPAYWHSEAFIGQALTDRRGEYILATKVGEHCDPTGSFYDYSAKATHEFVRKSLERLRTESIDLIQIHSASIEVLNAGETYGALAELKADGLVKHIGMSGGVPECIRAIEVGGYDSVQVPYNLLARQAEEKLLPLAAETQTGVLIMRPLAGGKLTRKYPQLKDAELQTAIAKLDRFAKEALPHIDDPLAMLALQYPLRNAAVTSLLAGTRRLTAVDANLTALAYPVPEDVWQHLEKLLAGEAIGTW